MQGNKAGDFTMIGVLADDHLIRDIQYGRAMLYDLTERLSPAFQEG